MTPNTTWRERFEKEFHFSDGDNPAVNIQGTELRNELIAFIFQEIERAVREREEELREKIEKIFTDHVDKSDSSKWGEEYADEERWRTEEHNAVVRRILSLLKEDTSDKE